MQIIERWKAVVGYEGLYEVSDFGNVRSLKYGKVRVLKPGVMKGYYRVHLCKNGKRKSFLVHRLVVIMFIGDIPKGMVVNHINENKFDNRLENLEIVTVKENNNHGTRNERLAKSNKISMLGNTNGAKQLDLMEVEYPFREFTFLSSCAASRFFGYNNKKQVGAYISVARKRGKNFINIRKKKYFFAQQ